MVISESQSPDLPFTYLLVAGAFVYGGQREHLKGVGSLLIQCGFSGSTSDGQDCQQVPLLIETSFFF